MRVIQPSTRSTLGEYDSCPPLARYVWCVTWYLRSSCCSETHYAHVKLPVFLPLSTLDVTHVRKCTRLSPLYRTKQRRKAGRGTGYEASVEAYLMYMQVYVWHTGGSGLLLGCFCGSRLSLELVAKKNEGWLLQYASFGARQLMPFPQYYAIPGF